METFLQEEKFSNQCEISRVALDHDPLDSVFNLDQTPLSHVFFFFLSKFDTRLN